MRVHQDVRVDDPSVHLGRAAQPYQKVYPVLFIKEDRLLLIAARGDMPESAFEFFAEWSCHNEPEDTSAPHKVPGFHQE